MAIQPRDYQVRSIEELLAWFHANPEGNPLMVLPTGSGKSIICAMLCELANSYQQKSRVLVVTPSQELCEQNLEKLVDIAPHLKIAVVSASMGRKDVAWAADVVIGTIGSLVSNPGNLGRIDLMVIDEAHLCQRTDTGRYRQLINGCTQFNRSLRVIGMTASPFRGNGIWLHSGEERLFTDIATRINIPELLERGYLAPLTSIPSSIQITSDGLGTSNTGDYILSQIAARIDKAEITSQIADEIFHVGRSQGRKKWIAFCVTVEHAEHMAKALQERGVRTGIVHGKLNKKDRKRIISEFKSGKLECLTTVLALLTGFDVPDIDLIAWIRNTKSPVLWIQGAGRGLRIAPGKVDCGFLDFTDSALTLGPIDQITGRNEPKPRSAEDQAAPYKLCDSCGASNAAGARVCVYCQAEFPEPEPKVHSYASGANVLSSQLQRMGYKIMPVHSVAYHNNPGRDGKPNTLRVEYWGAMKRLASEWICLEHPPGYARTKAEAWWKERWVGKFELPCPTSVLQAIDMVDWLKEPVEITVKKEEGDTFPRIVHYRFEESTTTIGEVA